MIERHGSTDACLQHAQRRRNELAAALRSRAQAAVAAAAAAKAH
jgi:hypothetical protein